MQTHTIEKDQIFYTAYYNQIWIPNLNKDKGVDNHRQFSETKNVGNGATTTRISHNALVSFNKEGKYND